MKKIIFTFLMLTCLALPVGAAGTELKDGFNQQHQGDVRVCARSITLNGQVIGNVYVESNGTFICAGSGCGKSRNLRICFMEVENRKRE